MDNKEAKQLIKETFNAIKKAKKVTDIKNFIRNHKVIKHKYKDENDYPSIRFNISKREIKNLIKSKLLSDDFSLSKEISYKESNTLIKILYSIIWKNQDLKKIRNIILGILDEEREGDSIVFYQFGKHLNNPSIEPIIDQNVMRAFLLYKSIANSEEETINKLRRKSIVNGKDENSIKEYKDWIKKSIPKNLRNKRGIEKIDKLLFTVGQIVKVKQLTSGC